MMAGHACLVLVYHPAAVSARMRSATDGLCVRPVKEVLVPLATGKYGPQEQTNTKAAVAVVMAAEVVMPTELEVQAGRMVLAPVQVWVLTTG